MKWRFRCIVLLFFCDLVLCHKSSYGQDRSSYGPSVQLHRLLPVTKEIRLERCTQIPISASVSLNPDSREVIEYTAILLVNGRAYDPFVTALTPNAKANLEPTWYVNATDRRMVVRLLIVGRTTLSGTTYSFLDVSKEYLISRDCEVMWLAPIVTDRGVGGCPGCVRTPCRCRPCGRWARRRWRD
jgi:hypothetical protein